MFLEIDPSPVEYFIPLYGVQCIILLVDVV